MNPSPNISVVIPVYGCVASLRELVTRLSSTLASICDKFEIILVNDASPDEAWPEIVEIARTNKEVKGINLSRNFGQHYAITAGLEYSLGDWVVVMDCDLQDVPEEIARLYRKAQEGYDIVVGRRAQRQDKLFKKLGSRLFYKVFAYFTGSKIDNRIGNFGIYRRKVICSIMALKEQSRSFGLFALWVGFRRIEIEIEHARRQQGESSYTLNRMLKLAMGSIVAHSNKLLHISVKLGFMLSFMSVSYACWLVVRYFMRGTPVAGWSSLMVSIYFTAGLIIGSIGVLGIYVGKIFDEVKGRPLYIVESTTFEVAAEE